MSVAFVSRTIGNYALLVAFGIAELLASTMIALALVGVMAVVQAMRGAEAISAHLRDVGSVSSSPGARSGR